MTEYMLDRVATAQRIRQLLRRLAGTGETVLHLPSVGMSFVAVSLNDRNELFKLVSLYLDATEEK